MKTIYVMLFMMVANLGYTQSAEKGEIIFQDNCKACHTVGGGKVVGPDLIGVSQRRKPDWLLKFINSPKKMIDGGDAIAIQLYEENNKVMMPDHAFITEEDVKNLIAYFESSATAKVEPAKPEVTTTSIDVKNEVSEKQTSFFSSISTTVLVLLIIIGLLLVLCLVQLMNTIYLLRK